jgi:hypothetical protein
LGKPQHIRLKSFDADFFRRALAPQANAKHAPNRFGSDQAYARPRADERKSADGVEDWLINEAAYLRQFGY